MNVLTNFRRPLNAAIILVFLPLCSSGVGSLAAEETEAATRQYAAAVGFQNQKLYDAAIDEWQTFLKKFPEDPRVARAWHYLGICSLQEKRFGEATRAFETVLRQHPKFELLDQSLLNLGTAQYGAAQKSESPADYAAAEKSFGQMLSRFPKSDYAARAQYYLGECRFQRGEFAQAAAAYDDLIAKHPQDELVADALYALGTAREELKQGDAARTAYEQLTKRFPQNPLVTEVRMRQAELLFADAKFAEAEPLFASIRGKQEFALADLAAMRQARCVYEAGKLNEAAALYWDLTRAFPESKHIPAAVLAGAKCFFLTGQYAKARSGLQRISTLAVPEAAEANQWLARSFLKEGQPTQALQVIDDALRRFRNSDQVPDLELARIDTLYEIKDSRSQTVEQYAAFAKKYPKHEQAAQAQYMAALTALDGSDPAAAGRYAVQFLQRFPDDALKPDVLFISAESQLLGGDHKAAAESYRDFLARSPQHANAPQARVRRGLALHLAGDYSQSIDWLEQEADKLSDKSLRSEAFGLIGRSYASQERFEPAAAALQKSFLEDPNREQNDETLLILADAYRRTDRPQDADEQLRKLVQRFPNSSRLDEAHFRLGEAAYAAGDLQKATTEYSAVMKQWPNGMFAPHAQYGLGWTLFNLGESAKSIAAMTELIEKFPQSDLRPKALYVRAMAEYQAGDHSAALRGADAFLATDPKGNDRSDALYIKGLALGGSQRFEQAAAVYSQILNDSPKYAAADKVAYELGWAYVELGKTDEAVAAFRRLATDYPQSPLAGESLYDAERYSEAATAYRQAAAQAGKTPIAENALHKLGWSLLSSDQFTEAATAFDDQLKAFPSGELAGDAGFLIGESRFRAKDWKAALAAYERVVNARSENYLALALYRSGECSANLEQWDAAKKQYERVLTDFPAFDLKAEARCGLGWALQNSGEYEKAIPVYEQVTEETQTETAAKARFMIGECLFALKKHDEATRHFLKAAFQYGHKEWSAMAYFEAARCFEVLRNVEQARSCYSQLIEKFPQHSKVADAERRLAALK
jgi:tol-pal system protein YbgF